MNGTELHLHIFEMHSHLMCESFSFLGGGGNTKGTIRRGKVTNQQPYNKTILYWFNNNLIEAGAFTAGCTGVNA